VKRAALLIVPVLLVFWACETVPDETGSPGSAPMDKKTGETVPVEAIEPAVTKDVEKVPEVEHPAEPLFRLDTVSSYLANGVLDTITTMVYETGRLLEERITYGDGSPAGRVVYTYVDGFLMKSLKTDNSGKVISSYGYVHNDAGNLIEETLLDTSGNPIFAYRFAYDSYDRRTELEILSSDGLVLSFAEYRYSDGRNDRIETFNLLGEIQEFLERTFDDAGRPVLEIVSEVSGTELEKVKFEYSGGLLVGRETYVQTRKIGSVEYRYDEAGNLAVRVRMDRTGKIIETNEYSYTEVAK
jgi:hypothetical protein